MARSTRLPPPQPDGQEIARALRVLIPDGQVTELRALHVRPPGWRGKGQVHRGWFDDRASAVAAAMTVSPLARAVYFMPNPCTPELLARCQNRLEQAEESDATTDGDIIRRRWLLIDCDPVRKAYISSSEVEHAEAVARIGAIRDALTASGWPQPVMGDSSNGGHLMYLIDEPADDKGLVHRCLEALSAQHSDERVKVDLSVANPARIWKLYGTVSRKGDNVPDRPHRVSRLFEVPEQLVQVTHEQLEALAALAPPAPPQPQAGKPRDYRSPGPKLDSVAWLDEWLREHGGRLGAMVGPKAWAGSGRKWVFAVCPWESSHTDRSAYLVQRGDGAIGAGCQHSSCQGHNWHGLRDLADPGWRERKRGEEPDTYYGKSRIRATRPSIWPPQPPPVDPVTGEPLLDQPPGAPPPPEAEGAEPPPEEPGGEGGGDGASGRCEVELDGDLEEQSVVLWQALLERCDTSDLYRAPHGVVRVHRDIGVQGERLLVTEMDSASWRAYIGKRVLCYVRSGKRWVPGYPTKDLAEYMLLSTPPGVRVVRDVYRMPAWVGSPPALVVRGYCPLNTVVVDSGPLELPPIPTRPSSGQVDEALSYWRWLTEGFPLAGDADFAHVLALALALVLRPQITGPVPLVFVTAPRPRSGKTLLLKSLHLAVTGEDLHVRTEAHDDEEWGKLITTALVSHPRMVCLDNVRRTLDSAPLAALLTSERWDARRLGRNDDGGLELSARAVWTATGNQPKFSDEIADRTLLIRLEPRVEDPSQRTGFHTRLPDDARRARPDLLWALHVLVSHWLAEGRPREHEKLLGGFESFVRVVGGVLRSVGVPGLLGNREDARKRGTGGLEEWRALAGAWLESYGEDKVNTGQVLDLCKTAEVFSERLGDKGDLSQRTRLGKLLAGSVGFVIGTHQVMTLGQDRKTKAGLWALRAIGDAPSAKNYNPPPTLRQPSAGSSSGACSGLHNPAEGTDGVPASFARTHAPPGAPGAEPGRDRSVPRREADLSTAPSASKEKESRSKEKAGGGSPDHTLRQPSATPPPPSAGALGEDIVEGDL